MTRIITSSLHVFALCGSYDNQICPCSKLSLGLYFFLKMCPYHIVFIFLQVFVFKFSLFGFSFYTMTYLPIHIKGFVIVSESSEITQFQVTIATNCRMLPDCKLCSRPWLNELSFVSDKELLSLEAACSITVIIFL